MIELVQGDIAEGIRKNIEIQNKFTFDLRPQSSGRELFLGQLKTNAHEKKY
jgi:hypothetical protein